MSYDRNYFSRQTASGNTNGVTEYSYKGSAVPDALAAITVPGYFNNESNVVKIKDVIYIDASDQQAYFYVTAVTPNVTIAGVADAADILLAEGNMLRGDANGDGVGFDASAAGQVLVGDGTTVNSVAVTGAIAIDATGATTMTLAEGSVLVGNASNEAAPIVANADGNILVGDGTTLNSVALSGSLSVDSTGNGFVLIPEGNILVGDALGQGEAINAAGSGDILVGNGTTVAPVAMNGDGTLNAAGTLSVTGASTVFGFNGLSTSSGPGAIPLTASVHLITTTGTGDALTLADGSNGNVLRIVYVNDTVGTDTAILTPTSYMGGSTITFNTPGDSVDLMWTIGGWVYLGGAAVSA